MKKLTLYFCLLLNVFFVNGQYYMRGEILDEKNQGIQNVKIFLHSAKAFYYSGNQGAFGITVLQLNDSLTLSLEGYEQQTIKVRSDQWVRAILKRSPDNITKNRPKLISVTKDFKQSGKFSWLHSDETYFQLIENDFIKAAGFPKTGFSLNVNKSSYSNIRRFLNMKSLVPPDAVRVEEMVNYFNLHYREPAPGKTFNIESHLTSCPWKEGDQLLYLNVSAMKLQLDKIPQGNFVFLIDVSGSMDMPNRLPLLKAAFQMFVQNLRSIDTISIVIYGGSVGIWLPPTSGGEKEKIMRSIEELEAAGDTPGESAIRAAYRLAERTFIKNGNNRVILATDGDFNVGETSEKALEELIIKQRHSGVYLTCLGVGMGNFKDSKLQTLARKGNGNYAYLDDIKEAEKTLVKELTQTFYAVADNVYLDINFNPAMVKEYRLIGFDNKREALTDSISELEGGEVGSGNSTLAVFQIVPTEQNQLTKGTEVADNLASMQLTYNSCKDSVQHKISYIVENNYCPLDSISNEIKFATAVTMFGLKLKMSRFIKDTDWTQISEIALSSADKNDYLQEEFISLIEKAKKLYPDKKRKKKKKK